MFDVSKLPGDTQALVWRFALARYKTSATRVRHRRVMEQITRAAYETDRRRHLARDTNTGKWFYAAWCTSVIPGGPDAPDVDKLQPTTSTILWSEHGMVTPHKPAVSEGEYDCYYCDGCVFYCDRCGESYCTACDPDGCLAP